ncbi:hypothetical protein BSL78_04654 [Apostichopus japonicus]|uniref:Uncharacterized protein n=1 Tax=Stichopus japonicus TaxID=307972 RepID=A0A2G8LDX1_STIJA|nr:hypothetical protein BSL78_04654 [Apostichopus japonicus]
MTQAAFDAMNYEKLNHEPSVKSFDEWKDYVFHSAGSLIGHSYLIQIRKEPVDGYNYLMSSPVILQNEVSPVKGLSHSEILQALKGGSAIEKAKDLCHHYVGTAKEAIKEFPNQEAKGALNNLLHALTTFR